MDVDGLHRQLDMEDSHLYMFYTPLTQWDAHSADDQWPPAREKGTTSRTQGRRTQKCPGCKGAGNSESFAQ